MRRRSAWFKSGAKGPTSSLDRALDEWEVHTGEKAKRISVTPKFRKKLALEWSRAIGFGAKGPLGFAEYATEMRMRDIPIDVIPPGFDFTVGD